VLDPGARLRIVGELREYLLRDRIRFTAGLQVGHIPFADQLAGLIFVGKDLLGIQAIEEAHRAEGCGEK
jgi:hypothetical protein